MKITQLYTDTHAASWREGIKKRYNFDDYIDPYAPTVFFGICDQGAEVVNNHKGFKLILVCTPLDEWNLHKLKNDENLYVIDGPHIDRSLNLKTKNIHIEVKDYSLFKPNVLGNKIYSYMRDPQEFKLDTLINIQKRINYEIIVGGLNQHPLYDYMPIEIFKEKYYDQCFLNINLSQKHGFVTVREMGLMGRKTIMNSPYKFPSQINFIDEDDIVRIINEESKKIGTIQESINPHTHNEEWLNLDFWKNDNY